jgi:hypothetical protein
MMGSFELADHEACRLAVSSDVVLAKMDLADRSGWS